MSTVSRKRTRNGEDCAPAAEVAQDEAASPPKRMPSLQCMVNRNTCTVPAVLSNEPAAQEERHRIDYTIKITKEMASSGGAPRPIRIYADGIYDMFHSGHARQLMQAKSAFPNVYLLVGVCNEELTRQMKGRTVMSEAERYEALRHCRYVDELVPDAPWTLDDDFLNKHKIDFVAHDDLPYGAGGEDDIYKWLKDRGMFVVTQRTDGISTTDVIARIIKDYDMYVRRNLARGYSAKELNVGFMKEKKIQFQEKVDVMRQKGRKVMEKIGDKRQELLTRWEEKSREFIGSFIDLFGRDGRLTQWIAEGRHRVQRAVSPVGNYDDDGYEDRSRTPSPVREGDSPVPSPPKKRGRPSAASGSSDGYEDDEF